jgi:ABC-type nickel/cobalt efflux system permease component RcnA
MIVLLLLLVLLVITGTLTFVLKVALGVALGLLLAVTIGGALVAWRIRRLLYANRRRWRRVRGSRSHIEVLDPGNRDV